MHIRPYLKPTNVSFYRIECMEVGSRRIKHFGILSAVDSIIPGSHNSARRKPVVWGLNIIIPGKNLGITRTGLGNHLHGPRVLSSGSFQAMEARDTANR
jgi:hypothetical protein